MKIQNDKIIISDPVPYRLASNVMRQGIFCDELARAIRKSLPEYLENCRTEAIKALYERGYIIEGE